MGSGAVIDRQGHIITNYHVVDGARTGCARCGDRVLRWRRADTGIATVLAEAAPETDIYTAEPAGFDDWARSLAAGERLANQPGAHSICDALLAPEPGALTFSINRRLVTGGVAVSDDDVRQAMIFAWQTLKLVVEPGGVVALAAALTGTVDCRDRVVTVVLSGGNVDAALYSEILRGG